MQQLAINNLFFERDDEPLFGDLSASWESGAVVQVTGHNGCGKTTLLRIIAGLLPASAGTITWNTQANKGLSFKSQLLFLGHHVGVKLSMSPLENLRWYFALNGLKAQGTDSQGVSLQRLRWALLQVGLASYEDVPCYSLSAGQQRRVALARLYLSQAPLWILDEPFTAIDKSGVASLEQEIDRHAAAGGIVLLTTHQRWKSSHIEVLDLEQYKGRAAHD
ncbi:cytochrome c biogenesis heme-transporting ATPase CcmA [Agaribacterium sp. ZY112]|uniref:cytochrome c biogenesis heme-transporting ATPase CcmA n=1 Tax=Agaribacterium sp. ZY112 TaxID=3233574 RepID=UPI003525B778